MIKLFCSLNANRLNILHWQLINFHLHSHQMAFSKEDKILIKNLQQLKGYTATVLLENSELKTGQEHEFWQFWNELLY